jgi:hypothetical protein
VTGDAGTHEKLSAPSLGRGETFRRHVQRYLAECEGKGVAVAIVIGPAVFGRVVARVTAAFSNEGLVYEIDHRGDLRFAQYGTEGHHRRVGYTVADCLEHLLARKFARLQRGKISRRWIEVGARQSMRIATVSVAEITAAVIDIATDIEAAIEFGCDRQWTGAFFFWLTASRPAFGAMKEVNTNSATSAIA